MRLLSLLIERFLHPRTPAVTDAAPQPAAAAPFVSLDLQMTKLTEFVSSSLERSALSGHYHAAAEDQLDAAGYALRELIKDLSAVMTVPATRAGAALYRLPAAAPLAIPARRTASAA